MKENLYEVNYLKKSSDFGGYKYDNFERIERIEKKAFVKAQNIYLVLEKLNSIKDVSEILSISLINATIIN